MAGLPDESCLIGGVAEIISKIPVYCSRFIREVNQAAERLVLDVPLVPVVLDAGPISVKSAADCLKMKVGGNQAGIKIGGSARVIARHIEGPMVHDVVEVNAN